MPSPPARISNAWGSHTGRGQPFSAREVKNFQGGDISLLQLNRLPDITVKFFSAMCGSAPIDVALFLLQLLQKLQIEINDRLKKICIVQNIGIILGLLRGKKFL